MRDRLRNTWQFLRASLWFIPVLMGAAAIALAITLLIHGSGVEEPEDYWLLYAGDTENARELLSSLLTGMITMTSLVVSITMVVLTLAAGQIGPRLIRNFIEDRVTQAVLGLFLADILYLLIVFRTIDGKRMGSAPHLAVSTGTGLTVLCLFVLLFYVHRQARSIIYDNVIRSVAAELRRAADRLLPDEARSDRPPHPVAGEDFAWVGLDRNGYVQTIDLGRLVAAARHANAMVRLEIRPGHYVIEQGEHVAVHPASARANELSKRIRRAFVIGSERTPTQDIEFGIRQLVEIATRALSPGINDVFTALAVIDNLPAALAHILPRLPEPAVAYDGTGAVRVMRAVADHENIIGAAFDQIRQAGSGHPAVLIRLADAIARLPSAALPDGVRRPLLEQLAMVLADGERSITSARDREILQARGRRAREWLDR